MVKTLITSANLATPGLLKVRIFENKNYDVIIVEYYVINKI